MSNQHYAKFLIPRFATLLLLGTLASGCTRKQPIQPGPSLGQWASTPPGEPWFGYTVQRGFCAGPICSEGLALFEDGRVLWLSWGPTGDWDDASMQGRMPKLRASDEPKRPAIESALFLLADSSDTAVREVRTATLAPGDAARIQRHILTEMEAVSDPGPVEYECTDVAMPIVVVREPGNWRVELAPRDSSCGENEDPQEAWFRIAEEGSALFSWMSEGNWQKLAYD